MKEARLLVKKEILGKEFNIYGDAEKPMFLAKDVASLIEHSDVSTMLRTVSEEEKLTQTMFVSGQNRETWFLTEDGLYEVLMQSRKPIAKQFKKQVKEILRTIRKHGMYATDELLDNPDFLIQTIQALKAEREQRRMLELENAKKQQIICELQPKATYYDLVLQNKTTIPISYIAKDYGMSAVKFNELLHELKIQYKLQGVWLLYSEHQDKGYTQSKTHVVDSSTSKMWTAWTQKGRLFLYEMLKSKKQILPLIERECTLAIVK